MKINNIWITFNRVIEQTKLVCVFLIENNVEKTDGNTKKIFNNVKITLVRVSFLVLKVRYQNHVRTKNLQLLDFKNHKQNHIAFTFKIIMQILYQIIQTQIITQAMLRTNEL